MPLTNMHVMNSDIIICRFNLNNPYKKGTIMKKTILLIILTTLSVNGFAYENLECVDHNDPTLRFSVQRIGQSEKFRLSVIKEKSIIYTETLKYFDWQGEAEYRGRYSYFINNGDEFIDFIHNGSKLKSTLIKCEVL